MGCSCCVKTSWFVWQPPEIVIGKISMCCIQLVTSSGIEDTIVHFWIWDDESILSMIWIVSYNLDLDIEWIQNFPMLTWWENVFFLLLLLWKMKKMWWMCDENFLKTSEAWIGYESIPSRNGISSTTGRLSQKNGELWNSWWLKEFSDVVKWWLWPQNGDSCTTKLWLVGMFWDDC